MHLDELIKNLPALFGALFLAILFIQSGLDKVTDWKGNLGWLTGHFEKTFIGGMVPMMLGTITASELATGLGESSASLQSGGYSLDTDFGFGSVSKKRL